MTTALVIIAAGGVLMLYRIAVVLERIATSLEAERVIYR